VTIIALLITRKCLAPKLVEAQNIPITITESPKVLSVSEIIEIKAKKYNVATSTIHAVVKCESGYNKNAIGDGGTSFGLVQINLPSHPNITREQALDVDFALDFLAYHLSKGNGRMWTCWRMLNT
jgi:soluble lytic murein transglycosylase-like protein